tara:strand:- start:14004 stop:14642 length:639 start_codon:yes stop_codon:yes gene_type:complete
MARSRHERMSLRRISTGLDRGVEPGGGQYSNELKNGVPVLRRIYNPDTGEYQVVQYIRDGDRILKNEFSDTVTTPKVIRPNTGEYASVWYVSDVIAIDGETGSTNAISVPVNTYLLDVRILVVSEVTAGPMNINVGLPHNTDAFIDGWDGSSGSTAEGSINVFGRASGATEIGAKLGKFFSETDEIVVDVATAATAGDIKILALLLQNPIQI